MTDTPQIDRRTVPRTQVKQHVLRVDLLDGHGPRKCFVWDLSERGARLGLTHDAPTPEFVSVYFGSFPRRAKVVWSKSVGGELQVGVEFASDTQS